MAVKSGWDEYGISYGMPTKQLVIRRLTCISPYSATIALGSEMSGTLGGTRALPRVSQKFEVYVVMKHKYF